MRTLKEERLFLDNGLSLFADVNGYFSVIGARGLVIDGDVAHHKGQFGALQVQQEGAEVLRIAGKANFKAHGGKDAV